jgi:DNA-binding transcriptional LysR family regulator
MSDRYVDFIEEGVDLVVRIGPLPDSGLLALKIGVTLLILYGSPEYLKEAGHPLHPDELVRHRFVAFVDKACFAAARICLPVIDIKLWIDIAPSQRLVFTDGSIPLRMRSGLGPYCHPSIRDCGTEGPNGRALSAFQP